MAAPGPTAQHPAEQARSAAAQLDDSRPLNWAARLGLASRGAVYLLMGVLAALLALGDGHARADQQGALTALVAKPAGGVLVALLALGFAGYSLWRLCEAAVGVTGEGDGAGPRLRSLARGLVYALLTATAVSVLLGAAQSQPERQSRLTAEALQHTGGRVAVAALGAAVVLTGLALVVEGWRASFMKYFRATPVQLHRGIRRLGQIGSIGRGAVFAVAGALVVRAAWTVDPSSSTGIDGALRTLLAQPYGLALGLAAAAGLVAFGCYGLAEAKYRRI